MAKVFLMAGEFARALHETALATAVTSRVDVEILPPGSDLPPGEYAFACVADTTIAVQLPSIDSAERSRLGRELARALAHAARLEKQLANGNFRAKAPAHVIAGMESTLAVANAKIAGLRARLPNPLQS